MKRRFGIFFLIYFVFIALKAMDNSLEELVPPAGFAPGWTFDGQPQVYEPDNLYEYINGEAELYIAYDFKKMVTANYVMQADEDATFSLDLYDMQTPLNAFGIYSSFRRPNLAFEAIGEEAIVSELNVRFYKGQYFVQLNAGSMAEPVREALLQMARALAEKLPVTAPAKELGIFPTRDQIPQSLKLVTMGFLGQSDFKQVLQADYQGTKNPLTVFVIFFNSEMQARAAQQKLAASLSARGQKVHMEVAGDLMLSAQTDYYGQLFTRVKAKHIVGAMGYEQIEQPEAIIRQLQLDD